MMLRVYPADLFSAFEPFSADFEEGISMMPRLRLVLTLKAARADAALFSPPDSLIARTSTPESDPWLGQAVQVAFVFEGDGPGPKQCRIPGPRDMFQGVITKYGHDTSGAFIVTIEPTLAIFKQRVRSRIFYNMDVADVIRLVLNECQVKYRFSEKLGTRELITQYEESDTDFALRLIAEHQLYYLFESGAECEVLVIVRHPRMRHPVMSKPLAVKYPTMVKIDERIPQIYRWDTSREFRAGRFSTTQPHAAKPGRGDKLETKRTCATARELAVAQTHTHPTNWQKGRSTGAGASVTAAVDWGRDGALAGGTLFLRPADCFHEPGAQICSPDNLFVVHQSAPQFSGGDPWTQSGLLQLVQG